MHTLAIRVRRCLEPSSRLTFGARTRATVLFALLTVAPVVTAQMVPVGFSANVRVDSAYYRADTLYVTHTASNAASSPTPLWGFVLETPERVTMQDQPATGDWLLNLGVFGGRQSAEWLGLGDAKTQPGRHTPPLSVHAVGLPDVVTYWVIAFTPPKKTEDPDAEPPVNPMLQRSVKGVTVGIAPVPAGATTATLTTRLRTLLGRACGDLGWIGSAERVGANEHTGFGEPSRSAQSQRSHGHEDTEHGGSEVCRELDRKLAEAERALARGATDDARDAIKEFAHKLDSQRRSHEHERIGRAGYALLRGNATYLLARWPDDEDKEHAHDRQSGTRRPDSE